MRAAAAAVSGGSPRRRRAGRRHAEGAGDGTRGICHAGAPVSHAAGTAGSARIGRGGTGAVRGSGKLRGAPRHPLTEEAVRVANDTEYGLVASLFGSDINLMMVVARQLNVGVCHIIGTSVRSDGTLPFGGVKDTGYGWFSGSAAIAEFADLRSLTIQTDATQHEL